ncbi:MAG: UDP-2,3-diacylglucosamine diphosphatase [Ginsengibacter sp.]
MDSIKKRKVEVVVISDVHLGTYGCHAKELLHYLKSIKPKKVILNGDIIDVWQFRKRYWPKSHTKIIKHLLGWVTRGIKTYYIPGNHDEMLRKFEGFKMGSLQIVNKLVLELDADKKKKAWIFHGDVFDVTMQHSKWLAKLGAIGYDILIVINRLANFISEKLFKKGKLSLSKKIKNSVKSALKYINNFEQTAADIGIFQKYDYVICGHIHHPEMKTIANKEGAVTYLNSGDWIENLTALEYNNGEWSIYHFDENENINMLYDKHAEEKELNNGELFNNLLQEFNLMKPFAQ